MSVAAVGPEPAVEGAYPLRRLKRRLSRKMSEEEAQAGDAEWRAYTPQVVDPAGCMGRTWNDGRGGQCAKPRVGGGEYCMVHDKNLAFGRVDGPIPEVKLIEFRKGRKR